MLSRQLRLLMTMASAAATKVPIPARGVDYRGKVVLAPMVRSGELPSRLLALHYGADLVWGPETVDHAMIGSTRRVDPNTGMVEWVKMQTQQAPGAGAGAGKKVRASELVVYRLDPAREAGKLVFQLGTADPERAVAAARLVAADVAGIDVNAGCPKPFSTIGGMGAALLRTPDRLCAILRALVASVVPDFQIGVSVKIRLLETAAETEALVRMLLATGITGLTVHCRTTPMRPRERAIRGQLPMVAALCREAGVACVMNGDVENRDQAVALMRDFGADAAMIATAAEKNPSCFRPGGQPSGRDGDGDDDGARGLVPWQEAVARYVGLAIEVGNRWPNTKYLLNMMIPGKDPVWRAISATHSYTQICDLLGLAHLTDKAREADHFLDLPRLDAKRSKRANGTACAADGRMAEARSRGAHHRKTLSERGATLAADLAPQPAVHVAQVT